MMHPILELANPFEFAEDIPADRPVAAFAPPVGAAAGCPIPAGYVLVEVTALRLVHDELKAFRERDRREKLPTFLENPSWQYLAAVERGAA